MGTYDNDIQEDVTTESDEKTKEPPMYRVFIHNDDFTTKEFVVHILMTVFNKSTEESIKIMWQAHKTGVGLCGIYSYEVAETKINTVGALAQEYGYPLRLSMEED